MTERRRIESDLGQGDPDPAAAKRAFDAMLQMQKIDIAAIEGALRGDIIGPRTRVQEV